MYSRVGSLLDPRSAIFPRRWTMLRPVIVGAVALVGVLLGASTAVAEPVFNYDVTKGTSTIKKLNSSVPLGPGKLVVDLDGASGNFTSTITLPPSQSSF